MRPWLKFQVRKRLENSWKWKRLFIKRLTTRCRQISHSNILNEQCASPLKISHKVGETRRCLAKSRTPETQMQFLHKSMKVGHGWTGQQRISSPQQWSWSALSWRINVEPRSRGCLNSASESFIIFLPSQSHGLVGQMLHVLPSISQARHVSNPEILLLAQMPRTRPRARLIYDRSWSLRWSFIHRNGSQLKSRSRWSVMWTVIG